MASGVSLTYRGSDEGARATAEAVAKSLDGLGISAGNVKIKLQEAEHGTHGLFGVMKDLRGEARQHERVFNYFGNSLASATGLAKGMSTELVGLGASLASGMWLVAGVEAIKLVVGHFREVGEEAKKAAEKAEKEFEGRLKNLEQATEAFHKKWLQAMGLDPEVVVNAKEMVRLQSEMQKLSQEDKDKGLQWKRMDELKAQYAALSLKVNEYREAAAKARHQEAMDQATEFSQQHAADFREKQEKAAEEAGKKRAATAREVQDKLAALEAEGLQGREQLEAQYEAKVAAIRSDPKYTEAEKDALVAAEQEARDRRIAIWEDEQVKKTAVALAADLKRQDEAIRLQQEAMDMARALELSGFDAQLARRFAKVKEEVDKEVEQWKLGAMLRGATEEQVDAGIAAIRAKYAQVERQEQAKAWEATTGGQYTQAMVSSFTQGAGQMLTSGQSLQKGLQGVWKGMASSFASTTEQIVQKWIMGQLAGLATETATDTAKVSGNAAVAASGAAASQASIPFAGPALALAAMGAMFAAVMAMQGHIGHAAAGWQLPSIGGPFPALLHTDEKVLPAKQSKGLDKLIESGGQQQPSIVLNFHASGLVVDGPSVYRAFRDQMPHIQKALTEATGRRS